MQQKCGRICLWIDVHYNSYANLWPELVTWEIEGQCVVFIEETVFCLHAVNDCLCVRRRIDHERLSK